MRRCRLFDEIVVLDTGSKDRTIEIARSFGARVFDFVWVDDFAAARNAAWRVPRAITLWLDADDLIEPTERRKLEALLGRLRGISRVPKGDRQRRPGDAQTRLAGTRPCAEGGQAPASLAGASPPASAFVVVAALAIRRRTAAVGIPLSITFGFSLSSKAFDGIIGSTSRFCRLLNGPGCRSNGRTSPYGIPDMPTGRCGRESSNRDLRILREELAERPDDPFTLFNLGSIAMERGEWNDALAHLKRSLAGSAPTDSIVRKLFALIAGPPDAGGFSGRPQSLRRRAGDRPGRC